MVPSMNNQSTPLRETLPANRTLMRFLLGMDHHMRLQQFFITKSFSANFTCIGLFPGVHPHMIRQTSCSRHFLTANLAHMLVSASMDLHMYFVAVLMREDLGANSTSVVLPSKIRFMRSNVLIVVESISE